jgi:hypothetical protein
MSVQHKWFGRRISQQVMAVRKQVMYDAGENILEEANRTIPHDEGVMQDSGSVSIASDGSEAAIYYDTPYTVRQHEDTSLRHPNGRRAKWLELTLQERGSTVVQWIATEYKRLMS